MEKLSSEKADLEKITGSIERITFHSEETGFCVLRIKMLGVSKPITLVGKALNLHEGETVQAAGQWKLNKKHGQQFEAEELTLVQPNTIAGIKKYLSSGLIKGIGDHFANVLVKAFGEQVFEIIEQHPQRLKKLPGIGKKRMAQILKSFQEQKSIRSIMVFLQSHGVSTGRAVRIYKTYGDTAIEKVKEFIGNTKPYIMAYVNQYDVIYTYKLFGNVEKPFFWIPIDFGSILFGYGIDPEAYFPKDKKNFFKQIGIDASKYREHHALDDAKLLREVYLKMTT